MTKDRAIEIVEKKLAILKNYANSKDESALEAYEFNLYVFNALTKSTSKKKRKSQYDV